MFGVFLSKNGWIERFAIGYYFGSGEQVDRENQFTLNCVFCNRLSSQM